MFVSLRESTDYFHPLGFKTRKKMLRMRSPLLLLYC